MYEYDWYKKKKDLYKNQQHKKETLMYQMLKLYKQQSY